MSFMNFNKVPTPSYVVDENLLKKNLELLKSVIDRTGCKILLAQKGFSMFSVYPLIGQYLNGTTASSLFEAKLGKEEMGKETHIFSPAYKEEEFEEIVLLCDHIVFNSFEQWKKYKKVVQTAKKNISCGIRINPEYSELDVAIYDPCAPHSRLGTKLESFAGQDLEGIDGLHFHTMCEQDSGTLKRTLDVVEKKFGKYFFQMKWINFGGGHHITREDYDVETLVECIIRIQEKYGLKVYLEPGEAVALNTGFLVSTVLDIVHNNMEIAILDTSASCHMPDVLEMPYRPEVIGAKEPGELAYTYRLGGPTCLAGDIIGDYSFAEPLQVGDKLVFCDMAHYSMVKNNTFNGIGLPSIMIYSKEKELKLLRKFGYEDFKMRLS